MCGIAGLLANPKSSFNGLEELLSEKAKHLALCSIADRGPDAGGEWQDKSLWLGHRRLAIVDTNSRGTQPLQRGQHVIAFNGMIYNYRELKRELTNKGYQFTTDTDTEVILYGWIEWQENLLSRLNGMFAIALWNQANKTLFLIRDRMGKKPLYYRKWKNGVAFGSRFDTIEALTEQTNLSSNALSWLLTLKYLPDPLSASEDIHKVPPGHLLKITETGVKTEKWYDIRPDCRYFNLSGQSLHKNLHSLIESAVAERLVSDVPLACFLSGGIDSAIITAMARSKGHLNTFTVSSENQMFDESALARKTAEYFKTNHHEVCLTLDGQLDLIDQLFNSALDEPFGDSSALPSLFVSKAMKEVATVALSGDGADELFGGYRKYQGELGVRFWTNVPSPVRGVLRALISKFPKQRSGVVTDKFRQIDRFLAGAELNPLSRHAAWMSVISSVPELGNLLNDNCSNKLREKLLSVNIPENVDELSAVLLRDIHNVLVSDMLVKIDRTSMYNGIEVRSPFLDHRIVEASIAIEGKQKIAWGQGKKILREVFRCDLPHELFSAPKRGFEIPLVDWLRGPLNRVLKNSLSPDFLVYNNLEPKIGSIIRDGVEQGLYPHAELGWTLVSIYHWQQKRGFI